MDILKFLTREIEDKENDMKKYEMNMNRCIAFGKQYWLEHDKWLASLTIKSYLADLIKRIEEENYI